MSTIIKKRISLVIAVLMIITVFTSIGSDNSYAASKPAKISGLNLSLENTGAIKTNKKYRLELEWKKVKGAIKYQVYRATSKKGKYNC